MPPGQEASKSSDFWDPIAMLDDRVLVQTTTDHPYSAVVQVTASFGSYSYQGSGVMITPYHVLTCAHILWDDNKAAQNVSVTAAKKGSYEPFGITQGSSWDVAPRYTYREDFDHDYAVITLQSDLGNRTGYAGYSDDFADSLRTQNISVVGYPGDKNGFMTRSDGTVSGTGSRSDPDTFTFDDLFIAPGNSGGPVYADFESVNPTVVGIATFSGSGYNGATKITEDSTYWIQNWTVKNNIKYISKGSDTFEHSIFHFNYDGFTSIDGLEGTDTYTTGNLYSGHFDLEKKSDGSYDLYQNNSFWVNLKNFEYIKTSDLHLTLDEYISFFSKTEDVQRSTVYGTASNDNISHYDRDLGSYANPDNPNFLVYGLEGDDFLATFAGDNIIYGNQGDDTIWVSGDGVTIAYGGQGNDTIHGTLWDSTSSENTSFSKWVDYQSDIIYGNKGDDNLLVASDLSHTLYGGQQNDIIYGGLGDDILYGNKGDDYFYPRGSKDPYYRDYGGNDQIYGGAGFNVLGFEHSTKENTQLTRISENHWKYNEVSNNTSGDIYDIHFINFSDSGIYL